MLAVMTSSNSLELPRNEFYVTPSISQKSQEYLSNDLNLYARPISVSSENKKLSKYIPRIQEIGELKENWDGNGASNISESVIINLSTFLKYIPSFLLTEISQDDIFPSPYGTIYIESDNGVKEISIEIGEETFSYFGQDGYGEFDYENLYIDKTNVEEFNKHFQRVFQ